MSCLKFFTISLGFTTISSINAMYVARVFIARYPHPQANTAGLTRFNLRKWTSLTPLQAQWIHARDERVKQERNVEKCAKNRCDASCYPYDNCKLALAKARDEEHLAYEKLYKNRQVLWANLKSSINLDEHLGKAKCEKKN